MEHNNKRKQPTPPKNPTKREREKFHTPLCLRHIKFKNCESAHDNYNDNNNKFISHAISSYKHVPTVKTVLLKQVD